MNPEAKQDIKNYKGWTLLNLFLSTSGRREMYYMVFKKELYSELTVELLLSSLEAPRMRTILRVDDNNSLLRMITYGEHKAIIADMKWCHTHQKLDKIKHVLDYVDGYYRKELTIEIPEYYSKFCKTYKDYTRSRVYLKEWERVNEIIRENNTI